VSVELRSPRPEDAAGISRMSDEFSRSAGGDPLSPAEAETWLGTPSLDLDLDARVVVAGKEIAGFADVFDPAGTGEALWCDVRADSAHPEAWTALLAFVERRAAERAAPGAKITVSCPERAAALREALESRGWAFERFSLRMLADFGDDLPEPDWPEGIDVRTFRKGEDERAVYEVQQETFSDLDNFAPLTFEVWKHFAFEEPFHPELWFLAEEEGELQGISLCAAGRGGDRELGWVAVLAVRRPWRGRGLGLALLRHSFRELRERGLKRVGLGVDGENATGAVRLYERAGMEVERRRLLYARHAS
jgi:mycothiol synthase